VSFDPDPIVRWEMAHLANLDLLEEGEIVCEFEEAWRVTGWGRGHLGALVVTDLRVLFLNTTKILQRTRVVSFPLLTIETAEPFDSLWKELGAFALVVAHDSGGDTTRVKFERIPGGPDRAKEIVSTIERQRGYLSCSS
jgi:hypothetical protein